MLREENNDKNEEFWGVRVDSEGAVIGYLTTQTNVLMKTANPDIDLRPPINKFEMRNLGFLNTRNTRAVSVCLSR